MHKMNIIFMEEKMKKSVGCFFCELVFGYPLTTCATERPFGQRQIIELLWWLAENGANRC